MSTIKAKAFQHPSATSNNITFNADGTHTVNAQHPTTSKNLLINGGMNVWQRATSKASISNTSTDGYVTADRWETYNNSLGTWTQSQSTDVPSAQGFGYSLKMDCTTADASPGADDELAIVQKIEGQNLQHLLYSTSSAKSLTFSFWVKSNKTGNYIAEFVRDFGLPTRSVSKTYTINSANTWEKKTISISGDTAGSAINNNTSRGLQVQFFLAVGSNFQTGTNNESWGAYTQGNRAVGQVNLADSTSNEWYLTGCQVEIGEQATGFEFEPYETVLKKCQRYYFENREGGIFGTASNSSNVIFRQPFPVTMRIAPALSLGGGTVRIGDMVSVAFSATNSPAVTANYNGPHVGGARISGFGGLTSYRTYLLEPSGSLDGYVKFSAEL